MVFNEHLAARREAGIRARLANIHYVLGVDEDVRTLHAERARWAQEVCRELQTEEAQRILHNIRLLRQHCEPVVVAKEVSRSRRVKAV